MSKVTPAMTAEWNRLNKMTTKALYEELGTKNKNQHLSKENAIWKLFDRKFGNGAADDYVEEVYTLEMSMSKNPLLNDVELRLAGVSAPTPADRRALKAKIMSLAKEARVMASGLNDGSSLAQAAGFLERAAQAVKNAKF